MAAGYILRHRHAHHPGRSVDRSGDSAIAGHDSFRQHSIQLSAFTTLGNISGTSLGKLDYPVGTGILPTALNPASPSDQSQFASSQVHDPAMVQYVGDPVRVYALNGSIIDGAPVTSSVRDDSILLNAGATGGQISLITNAPAQLYAAIDILDLPFYGENFTANDITSLIAGRDISYNVKGNRRPTAIELAGPGTLDVEAGRNINFQTQRVSATPALETGIRTIGNSIDTTANPTARFVNSGILQTTTFPVDFGNPYLPVGGCDSERVVRRRSGNRSGGVHQSIYQSRQRGGVDAVQSGRADRLRLAV